MYGNGALTIWIHPGLKVMGEIVGATGRIGSALLRFASLGQVLPLGSDCLHHSAPATLSCTLCR